MQTKNEVLEKTAPCQSAGMFLSDNCLLPVRYRWLITCLTVLRDGEASQLEASSSSGLCCNNQNLQATSSDQTSRCNGVNLDELAEARNMGILKLSPADEVEGELIYYQQSLLQNAVLRKRISGLYSVFFVSLLIFGFIHLCDCLIQTFESYSLYT